MGGAHVGTLKMDFEGCSWCCSSFVLLLIEVGLDQVPFKRPLQPKPPWDSVVLWFWGLWGGVLRVPDPFLSHPEHPRGGAVTRL